MVYLYVINIGMYCVCCAPPSSPFSPVRSGENRIKYSQAPMCYLTVINNASRCNIIMRGRSVLCCSQNCSSGPMINRNVAARNGPAHLVSAPHPRLAVSAA